MDISDKELLRRLGSGESIKSVCSAAGLSRDAFDTWWKAQSRARVPEMSGTTCCCCAATDIAGNASTPTASP